MHRPLVICHRTSSKDSLEKNVYEDLLCARCGYFFFHKEAYNCIAVGIFLLLFFTDISLQNDYLVENVSKNNGFQVAENPAAVALIGGKELFLFSWLEHSGFSQNIFAMKN